MFKLDDFTSWYPGIPVKGGGGVGDRVWYGGDDRIGLGLQMAISSCKPWLLAIAIGLQMAIEGARAQQLLSPDRISGGGVDAPCNPGTPPVRSG